MLYSPLDQFDVVCLLPLKIFNVLDLSMTNLSFTTMVAIFTLFVFFKYNIKLLKLTPSNYQMVFEMIFMFIYRLLLQQIGKKGLIYLPLFFSIFFYILVLNLWSLMPGGFAVTSHFIWTVYFSTSLCLGIFFIGLINHGFKFLKIFLPEVPLLLVPLMVMIEIASYIIRSFSLAIRLSANIMAGHTLTHIMGEACVKGVSMGVDLTVILVLLVIAIFVLELGVACLQAYVFTLLLAMYLNDAVNLPVH